MPEPASPVTRATLVAWPLVALFSAPSSAVRPTNTSSSRVSVGGGRRRGSVGRLAQHLHLLAQDRPLQLDQRRPRVEAELVGEQLAGPAQRGERVGGAAGGPQRQRQQAPALLVQRVLPGDGLGQRYRGAGGSGAQGQRGVALPRPPGAARPAGRSRPAPSPRRRTRRRPGRATAPAPRPGSPARRGGRPSAGPGSAGPRTSTRRRPVGSRWTAYPGAALTRIRAAVRGGRSGSSTRRRLDTYACRVAIARGGGSPRQRSSIMRSTETTSPRLASSSASTARWRGPPRSAAAPSPRPASARAP